MKNKIPFLLYPFAMSVTIASFFVIRNTSASIFIATNTSIFFCFALILFFEKHFSYKKEWTPTGKDWTNDILFFLIIKMLAPMALIWELAHFLIRYITAHHFVISELWPHHFPLLLQVMMLILISDLVRYWIHRMSHTIPFLWRFHAVHHSVKKLYWLNTSRFHPLEKGVHFIFAVLPFMLLGVSEEVIALHFVIYASNGSFQHCNIKLHYGWLNYIISSAEHHRWHHSREIKESNNNYGNTIILWDLVFGSFYLPANQSVQELGLINKNYPLDFGSQMLTPLIDQYDKIDRPHGSVKTRWLSFFSFHTR